MKFAEGMWGRRELCIAIFTYSAQRNVHARFTKLSLLPYAGRSPTATVCPRWATLFVPAVTATAKT